MQPLRYSINVTLDGCVDHQVGSPDQELHEYSAEIVGRADVLLFGRTTYELMEFWKDPGDVPEWMDTFARTIGSAKKYVVSETLGAVDAEWNAELLPGDLLESVRALKNRPGRGIYTGGVTLPTALANAGLIDEYEFVVSPMLAGHGPYLFEGLATPLQLELVGQRDFRSGAVARRYVPRR